MKMSGPSSDQSPKGQLMKPNGSLKHTDCGHCYSYFAYVYGLFAVAAALANFTSCGSSELCDTCTATAMGEKVVSIYQKSSNISGPRHALPCCRKLYCVTRLFLGHRP